MKKISLIIFGIIVSLLFTSCSFEKEYGTSEFYNLMQDLEFKYNPAKLNVKQTELKEKWIVIECTITDIFEYSVWVKVYGGNGSDAKHSVSANISIQFEDAKSFMDLSEGDEDVIIVGKFHSGEFNYRDNRFDFLLTDGYLLKERPENIDLMCAPITVLVKAKK